MTLKEYVSNRLKNAKSMYLDDLNAMSEESLTKSPGGSARTAADFTFECVYVNNRVAMRLRGEDPGPFSNEGWMKAPDEFKSKETLVSEMTKSMDDVIAAWNNVPDADITTKIALPNGETSPLDMASLVATHLTYHDAQLNYMQSIEGDDSVHWKFD